MKNFQGKTLLKQAFALRRLRLSHQPVLPVDRLVCTTPIPQTPCALLRFEQGDSGGRETLTQTSEDAHVHFRPGYAY